MFLWGGREQRKILPVRNSLLRAPVSMPASPKNVTFSLHLGVFFFWRCHCCMPRLKSSILERHIEKCSSSLIWEAMNSKISSVLKDKTRDKIKPECSINLNKDVNVETSAFQYTSLPLKSTMWDWIAWWIANFCRSSHKENSLPLITLAQTLTLHMQYAMKK